MKYNVNAKGKRFIIFIAFVSNLILLPLTVLMWSIASNLASKIAFTVVVLILDALLFLSLRVFLMKVVLDEKAVKCLLMGRVTRSIPYSDIKDYGTFWHDGRRFIYISKIVLGDVQKYVFAFIVFRRSKDIIAVEYHEEIMNKLDNVTRFKKSKN